eukprot:8499442-Ditylum_brightwellii.AAC.1
MMLPNPQRLTKNGGKAATTTFVMDTGPDNLHKYEQESTIEKIKAQGVKAVNSAKKFITATAINFVVLLNATSYAIRNKFVQLTKTMQSLKPSLTIMAAKATNNGWYQTLYPVEM